METFSVVKTKGEFMMRPRILGGLILWFLASLAMAEQQGDVEPEGVMIANAQTKKKSKRRKSTRRRPGGNEQASSSSWFPNWPVGNFDYYGKPIVGFQGGADTKDGVTTTTASSELGLAVGLINVPLFGDNPGMRFNPNGGYALGSTSRSSTVDSTVKSTSSDYTRMFGGGSFVYYHKAFRYTLGVTSAQVKHEEAKKPEDQIPSPKSIRIVNEPAILLKQGWSLGFNVSFLRSYQETFSEPEFEESDYFLYTRKQWQFLQLRAELGPGHATIERENGEGVPKVFGQSTYLLNRMSAHLFWKIRASLRMKYVIEASSKIDDRYAEYIIPDQDLSDPSSLATLPKDTFEQTFAVTVSNLFAGIGLVWQYHRVVYNTTETSGTRRSISGSSWGVNFSPGI